MVNATLINATGAVTQSGLFSTVWDRTLDLIKAPINYPEMFWIATPLILVLVIMEFYFGRYEKEELGWNTAVANALLIVFVAIDLFRYVHNNPPTEVLFELFGIGIYKKTIMVLVVALVGLVLFLTDFFHFLPQQEAFFFSSGLPTHLLAYVGIVIVYSDAMPLDWITLMAGFVLFVMLFVIFEFIHFIEPKAKEK